jgi:hypothetical protein
MARRVLIALAALGVALAATAARRRRVAGPRAQRVTDVRLAAPNLAAILARGDGPLAEWDAQAAEAAAP